DRLAPLEEVEDGRVDAAVGLAVEVLGPQEFGDLDDGIAVDEDRAEHGLLGLEALRWKAVDHRSPRVLDGSDNRLSGPEGIDGKWLIPQPHPRLVTPRLAACGNHVDIHPNGESGCRAFDGEASVSSRTDECRCVIEPADPTTQPAGVPASRRQSRFRMTPINLPWIRTS